MLYDRDDDGHDRIATLDIETTHYKPHEGETVSVGLYVHDRGEPADAGTYEPFHRSGPDDEVETIRTALERLDEFEADVNTARITGRFFDYPLPTQPHKSDEVYRFLDALVPDLPGLARSFNLALLDLGALWCTDGSPECESCPVRTDCAYTGVS